MTRSALLVVVASLVLGTVLVTSGGVHGQDGTSVDETIDGAVKQTDQTKALLKKQTKGGLQLAVGGLFGLGLGLTLGAGLTYQVWKGRLS